MAPSGESTEQPDVTPAERRRDVVKRTLDALMRSDPQLYYRPTADVARAIHESIGNGGDALSAPERDAVKGLSARDIEVILAFR